MEVVRSFTTTCARSLTVWLRLWSHSGQGRDQDYPLCTEYRCPLEAKKNRKSSRYQFAAIQHYKKKTNRSVCDETANNAHSARRDLSEGRVTEAKLLDQESIVRTEQIGCASRICERRDGVNLEIAVVRRWEGWWDGMYVPSFQ